MFLLVLLTNLFHLNLDRTNMFFMEQSLDIRENTKSDFASFNRKLKFVGYGLKVKVEDSINLPVPSETFEVFITHPRDTSCAPDGISIEELMKKFPLKTKVRIIGSENVTLLGTTSSAAPRIEISYSMQGQLFNNIDKKGKPFLLPNQFLIIN